jgi:hypothetical protein
MRAKILYGVISLDGASPAAAASLDRLRVQLRPDIRYDQNDALNQPLQFTGSESARMDRHPRLFTLNLRAADWKFSNMIQVLCCALVSGGQ